MEEKSPSQQIDDIISDLPDWKGEKLARIRAVIRQADPEIVEEVKWKKPSRPEGVPVWTHGGNICIGEALKNAVRLTFPNGAELSDPTGFFNTRLDSKTVRATDLGESDELNEAALKALIVEAIGSR
jgi:hypothetical protein